MEGSGLRCGPNSEDRGAYHESVHEYDSRHLRSSKGSFRPSDVGLDGDGGVPVSVLMLTGARGSGKSCVGAALAAQQDRPFVDLDAAALALTGLDSVAEVFEQAGEHAWRQAEAAALKESLRIPEVIIATGGGVPCIDPGRSQLLRARSEGTAIVVWLRCSPEVRVNGGPCGGCKWSGGRRRAGDRGRDFLRTSLWGAGSESGVRSESTSHGSLAVDELAASLGLHSGSEAE